MCANDICGICRHVLVHPRDISLNCLIKLMCSGDYLLKIKQLMYIYATLKLNERFDFTSDFKPKSLSEIHLVLNGAATHNGNLIP